MTTPQGMTAEALEAQRRRSGVRLEADGTFTYLGRPVESDRVVTLFQRGLDVREDGEVTLTVGRFWCYPEVVGVARFVRAMRATHEGGVAALCDGRELALAGAAVAYGPDDRFYLWFDGLRGPAVALRTAHQVLAGALAADPDGLGQTVAILPRIPLASAPRPAEVAAWPGLWKTV